MQFVNTNPDGILFGSTPGTWDGFREFAILVGDLDFGREISSRTMGAAEGRRLPLFFSPLPSGENEMDYKISSALTIR